MSNTTPPTPGQTPWGADLNAYLAWLEQSSKDYTDARIAAALAGGGGGGGSGTVTPSNCTHSLTSTEPVLHVVGSPGPSYTLDPSDCTHFHTAESASLLATGLVELTIQTGAPSIHPWIGLTTGPTAVVTWRSSNNSVLATGLQPTITTPGDRIVRLDVTVAGAPALDRVDFINLGFNNDDDGGHFSIGTSYNWPGQPVVDIYGLQLCSEMRYFMAGHTPLHTALNFSGMANLEYIECFNASIVTCVFTDCVSLIRLCVEACAIDTLDFSTVKNTLRDLRCAANASPYITLTSNGPMSQLYHYCVRDQHMTHLPQSQLPVVEECLMANTYITELDAPVSPALFAIWLHSNYNMSQATWDRFLNALAGFGLSNTGQGPYITGDSTPPPSHASDAARASLVSRGWALDIPPSDTLGIDGSNGVWTPPTHVPWSSGALTPINVTPTVTSGVLTFTASSTFAQILMQPGGRVAGDVFFEVAIDRSEITSSIGLWSLFANAKADGTRGVKVQVDWSATNPSTAAGVVVGASNDQFWDFTYGPIPGNTPMEPEHATTRVAPNPAGWTNAGTHKVGMYLARDTVYLVLDGVKVYKSRGKRIDQAGWGPYVGVNAYSYDEGPQLRTYQTWGIANVTGISGWS